MSELERLDLRSRRVVIGGGNRKREIMMPFGISGSRETMVAIRDSIDVWLADPLISYGWCRIDLPAREEWVFGPTDSRPEPWDGAP